MDPQQQAALNTARTNFEMAHGISRGIPPTNPQIASVLQGTERALNSASIPPESQKLGHDAAALVNDMKTIFLEKNKDENIQGLIKDMGGLTTSSAQQVSAKAGPGGIAGMVTRAKGLIQGQEGQATMQQGMDSVKLLVKGLVRNPEFRSGLRDLFHTFQWAFYQRSQVVRTNVDQHWGSDQYYTYYSTPGYAAQPSTTTTTTIPTERGLETTTVTSTVLPSTTAEPTVLPSTTAAPTVLPSTTAAPTVLPSTTAAPTALPSTVLAGSSLPGSTGVLYEQPIVQHPRTPQTAFEKKLANVTPMTLPERIDFRNRMLSSLLRLNRTPELRDASSNFMNVLTWIRNQSLTGTTGKGARRRVPTTGPGVVPMATSTGIEGTSTTSPPDFKTVMKRFQRLVEEFTGNKSLDDLIFYTRELFQLMTHDENLRCCFTDSATWGRDFFNAGYTTQEAIPAFKIQQLDALIQRIDHTFVGLANHYVIWRLLEEIQQVSNAIRDDPFRQKMAQDARVFVSDFLFYDQMGRPQLNPSIISQLKYLVVPILQEEMAYIPLPRIEHTDEKMDYWVENVILTTTDILPDNVKFDIRSKTLLNRPGLTGNQVNVIRLTLDNVRIHLKDVRFWYRKKTFPKMTDQGCVDFFLTRNGLRVTLELLTNFLSDAEVFTVNQVRVNADRLKIKIHESRHDFLYAVLLAFFTGRVKREIELQTENAIRKNFSAMNTNLSRIVHAAGAKRSAATSSLGAKTSGPIASALDTFVHPSVTH